MNDSVRNYCDFEAVIVNGFRLAVSHDHVAVDSPEGHFLAIWSAINGLDFSRAPVKWSRRADESVWLANQCAIAWVHRRRLPGIR